MVAGGLLVAVSPQPMASASTKVRADPPPIHLKGSATASFQSVFQPPQIKQAHGVDL